MAEDDWMGGGEVGLGRGKSTVWLGWGLGWRERREPGREEGLGLGALERDAGVDMAERVDG